MDQVGQGVDGASVGTGSQSSGYFFLILLVLLTFPAFDCLQSSPVLAQTASFTQSCTSETLVYT